MEGLVKFEDLPEEDEVIDNIPSTIINVRNEDAEEMDEVIDEPISIVTSQEYTDALQRLSLNSWDIVAWRIYLEEVKEKKSGSVSVVEGYEKFLNKFPRAFRVWKELAEHYNFCGNISQAQEIFDQIKSKCRDVDVWRSYLLFFKNQLSKTTVTKSTVELSLEYYDKIKKEYEKAIDNVGMSVDAYQIWRDYIDLVKEEIEKTKNTEILRQLYHRALSVPMEGLEFIWKEYEAWETVPDKVVEDFKHAKAIFKDRKKLTSPIDFQRLAVPPTRSLNETVQLDHWNNWIRYRLFIFLKTFIMIIIDMLDMKRRTQITFLLSSFNPLCEWCMNSVCVQCYFFLKFGLVMPNSLWILAVYLKLLLLMNRQLMFYQMLCFCEYRWQN